MCESTSPCKEYQVCEDTFKSYPSYKCTCREGFHGDKCETYEGIGLISRCFVYSLCRRGAVVKGVEHISANFQHLSGAGSSPAGSISRDLDSQSLHY